MLKKISNIVRAGGYDYVIKDAFVFNTDEVSQATHLPNHAVELVLKTGHKITINLSYHYTASDFMDFLVNDDREFKNYSINDIIRTLTRDDDNYYFTIRHMEPMDDFSEFRKSIPSARLSIAIGLYGLLKKEGYVNGNIPEMLTSINNDKEYPDIMKVHEFGSYRRQQNLLENLFYNDYKTTEMLMWDVNTVGIENVIPHISKCYRKEVEEIVHALINE